jgi:hypothetical protein
MTTEIKRGDVVWVEGGGKLRPAVVVRIMPRHDVEPVLGEKQIRILAPWGTGTFRPDK